MQKDFDKWNSIKKIINDTASEIFCNPREIWVCSIGANIGVEADGKHIHFTRPVLVYRVINRQMFWGIPLTTKKHIGPAYFSFNLGGVDNVANITQMRPMSSRRLDRKITVMPEETFVEIQKKVRELV